jgi:hypothetical protein
MHPLRMREPNLNPEAIATYAHQELISFDWAKRPFANF